jgi:hypothetical protein
MNLAAQRKWTTLLFNPFVYVAGGRALGLGSAAIFVAGAVAVMSQTHFDGVLDMHAGRGGPWMALLAEGFIDWLCLASVLAVCGKLVSKTSFRIVDVFGTQALARWPTIFMTLLTLPPAFARFSNDLLKQLSANPGQIPAISADAIYFFAAVFLLLPLLVWMVALMYNSYSVSCNVRGARAIGTFVIGLILAEIISKIVIDGLLDRV